MEVEGRGLSKRQHELARVLGLLHHPKRLLDPLDRKNRVRKRPQLPRGQPRHHLPQHSAHHLRLLLIHRQQINRFIHGARGQLGHLPPHPPPPNPPPQKPAPRPPQGPPPPGEPP